MEPNVMASGGLLLFLSDLVTASEGNLAGAKVKLFTNDVDPGVGAVIGDFTLATFTGSTPIAIATWGEAYLDAQGNACSLGSLCQFDYDSGATETVYGFVLTNASDALLGYARLETPKEMDDTNDSVAFVPKISVGPSGFGTSIRAA